MMTGTEFVFPCRSLTYQDSFCRITVPRKGEGVAKTLKAVPPLSDKGGVYMPITLTFHILGYTITVTVKSRNRHSAK